MNCGLVIRCKGTVPEYQREGDAGADLVAAHDFEIEGHSSTLVLVDTILEIPNGIVGLICSRSGLAQRKGIHVLNSPGVIDSGFRGRLGAILRNTKHPTYKGYKGDRIAQILFVPAFHASFIPSETLEQSTRGEGRFGSTGT